MELKYQSTKTFGHELGLSACFRQWRAHDSHCSKLHGYALSFMITFEATALDERNWVVDFGGLKTLRGYIEQTFDHKLLVAEDDPALETIKALQTAGIADVVVMPALGCEMYARMVFEVAEIWLRDAGYGDRCRVVRVECREHGANSAICLEA